MSMNDLETKVAELRELRRIQEELAAEIAADGLTEANIHFCQSWQKCKQIC